MKYTIINKVSRTGTSQIMVPPDANDHICRCDVQEETDSFPEIIEHAACGDCLDAAPLMASSRRMISNRGIAGGGESHDIHRRNISTVASPVILMFDGFHNIVYHLYLATR